MRARNSAAFIAIFLGYAILSTPAQTCVPPPPGLISWWPADGDASDVAGNNPGVQKNGAQSASGEVRQALSFNGSNQYVEIPHNSSLIPPASFTIEAWIYPAQSADQAIFSKWSNNERSYIFSVTAGNGLGFGISDVAHQLDGSFHSFNTSNNLVPLNSWSHVAAVYDQPTGKRLIYLNGLKVAERTDPPIAVLNASNKAAIGARLADIALPSNLFGGRIDEVSFYGRALSSTEIGEIYGGQSAGKCPLPPKIVNQPPDQVANVGANVTLSVLAAGVGPLTYQWSLNGGNIPGATNPALNLANIQSANAGTYNVIVTSSYGSVISTNFTILVQSSRVCVPLPAGLISWWQGNGDASDLVGTNSGLLQNGLPFAVGEVGQGFSFNGTSQYVEIPSTPSLIPAGSFSIEAWINPSRAADQAIFSKWSNSQRSYIFSMTPGNGLAFGISDLAHQGDSSFHVFDSSDSLVPLNTWSHVAAVYDQVAGKRLIYLNGNQVAERTDAPISVLNTLNSGAIGARLAEVTLPSNLFGGIIDEVSFYGRALSSPEIQAVYNAKSAGKCPSAPIILNQPQNESANPGSNVSLVVLAAGVGPLSYQWFFNGANVAGATNSVLKLLNIQAEAFGTYSVVVISPYGAAVSANAAVTLLSPITCTPPPESLISWWTGEGDASDALGANPGTLKNGALFKSGEVGQAFSFNGSSQYVEIPHSASLIPSSSFSIEAWIYPVQAADQTIFSKWSNTERSYTLTMTPGNGLRFGISDVAHQLDNSFHLFDTANNLIPLNSWSHVAAVYDQSTGKRQIYLNGVKVAERTDPPLTVLNATNKAAIGARMAEVTLPSNLFGGMIDEVSFYLRALSEVEIGMIYKSLNAGKCQTPLPPTIVSQPKNLTVVSGANLNSGTSNMALVAAGSGPLRYQWVFNGTNLPNATNSFLNLSDIQSSNAGTYDVSVSNAYGTVISSNAILTVIPGPSIIQAANVTTSSGIALVPVNLTSRGLENSVAFSLIFNPATLIFDGVFLGNGAGGASLIIHNTNQVSSGRLGLAVSLPDDKTFPPGLLELLDVRFVTAFITNTTVTSISFGDQPVLRQVVNSQGSTLPSTFTGGSVTIPFLGFEGDVSPRLTGDAAISTGDWLEVGRLVVGLDTIANGGEFQRADTAPRSSLGDGFLTVADWVQAARYAAGVDPVTVTGGPAVEAGERPPSTNDSGRSLILAGSMVTPGQVWPASIQLISRGNENAVGFSLNFDPSFLTFSNAVLGTTANGAFLNLNTNGASSGNLGVALALPVGSTFLTSTSDIVTLNFVVSQAASNKTAVSFISRPAFKEISDANGNPLPATFVDAVVTAASDNNAPFPPLIFATVDDTGFLNLTGITRNPTLVLKGASEAGKTVIVTLAGQGILGQTNADANGNWTFDLGKRLSDGTYTFSAVAVNSFGTVSDSSDDFSITIDSQPPAPPSGLILLKGYDSGNSSMGLISTNIPPSFAGMAESNSTVALFVGANSIGTTTTTAAGEWTITGTNLATGTYHIVAIATDRAGNSSLPSNELIVTIRPVPQLFSLSQVHRKADGSVQMVLVASPHLTYAIQISNDLKSWRNLAIITTTDQSTLISDDSISAQSAAYYRAVTGL